MSKLSLRKILNKKQKGFTAIELMFALGVIALGTVALVLVSKNNTNKQNSNIMVADVSSMVQSIQASFASNSDGYNNLSNSTAISSNLVPADLTIGSDKTTIKSKFQGGTVTIAAGGNNDNFIITYTNVPASVCNSVVTTLGGSAFSDVSINGTSVYNTTDQKQLDTTQVGTACNANKDQETIIFTAS